MHDLVGSYQRLENIYRMYIKSAFPLRDRAVARERETLLKTPTLLSQPPLLETVPVYPSSGLTLDDAADSLMSEYSDIRHLAQELFPPHLTLYNHQWQSLNATLGKGRDIVVTTGTGSGKTECFLLPLLGQLAYESASWKPCPPPPSVPRYWWEHEGQERISQWRHVARPTALRAIVLYPLNALVEDQLRRLRTAVDSSSIHTWMDRQRGGNRITFGRYTSMTPVPGFIKTNTLKRLRNELWDMSAEFRDVMRQIAQGSIEGHVQWYFANPDGGEMWSRWDMQETPPDILITNYSMLNIMMMRRIEDSIFDETKKWLAEPGHPERVFHLIVDELHAYRGTPGTEVAYIIRLLLNRLGLAPDSPKLRILTTTASLENDDKGHEFLGEFFGRDNFEFISGEEEKPKKGAHTRMRVYQPYFERFVDKIQANPLDPMAPPHAADDKVVSAMRTLATELGSHPSPNLTAEQQLAAALQEIDAADALRDACQQVNDSVRPTRVPQLDDVLFADEKQQGEVHTISPAMRGLLLALGLAKNAKTDRSPQPVRGHLFFHNLQNLWACSNPYCTDPSCDRDERIQYRTTIGALHSNHRLSCSCGSRVLDFIICEVCGDIFLGGHKTPLKNNPGDCILTADDANLDAMPERTLTQQTYGQYALFWPQPFGGPDPQQYPNGWTDQKIKRNWSRAKLNPTIGLLRTNDSTPPQSDEVPGWVYVIQEKNSDRRDKESALPTRCPNCDADYRYRQRVRTPLRSHRTGFQKACQVLSSSLMREMPLPDEIQNVRKLVIFSDSRQDAAKLAAGMEHDHYRDLIRIALIGALGQFWSDLVAFLHIMARSFIPPHVEQNLNAINPNLWKELAQPSEASDMEGYTRFTTQNEDLTVVAQSWWMGLPSANQPLLQIWLDILHDYPGRVPLSRLRNTIFNTLLELGVNPGGPTYVALTYTTASDRERSPWYECYNWTSGNVLPTSPLTPEKSEHISYLNSRVLSEVMYALFPHMARSLESLGQGWVSFRSPSHLPKDRQQALDAVIRLLGSRRRHTYARHYRPDDTKIDLPLFVKQYVNQVGLPTKVAEKSLLESGTAVPSQQGLILNPENLYLVPPPPVPENERLQGYRCPNCNAFYLHEAVLTCPECMTTLEQKPIEDDFDYYNYLSERSGEPFRMNSEELTGQTDRKARGQRQRWFQDIFIGKEISIVQGVDLLSVTTTMEAGVDIGALLATMLANMPPRRFNYQQRVGRAGRRNVGVSLAVTFCRGRSHDDYYFLNPEKITGDPPPAPYVDMNSYEIIKRVIVKEVLRLAFQAASQQIPAQEEKSDSVHGEFGDVETWNALTKPFVTVWLQDNSNVPKFQEILDSLRAGTVWQGVDGTAFCTEIITFIQNDLANEIDHIANDTVYTQSALSERLANAGLLPMFGFPTRVRLLHTRWPSSQDWPPEVGVVDRNLDIAISQFAPGSQTIKDKAVHNACGVVSFVPQGYDIGTEPGLVPPLDRPNDKLIGLCRHCRAVVLQQENPNLFPTERIRGDTRPHDVTCPVCGELTLRPVDAREPRGFFTDFRPEDFEGQFEWTPRSTIPSINFRSNSIRTPVLNTQVSPLVDDIISINDNGGMGGFDFQDATIFGRPRPGAYTIKPQSDRYVDGTGLAYRVALLSKRKTDILLAGIDKWPDGLYADPTTAEGRAAWYSFAFWLRSVAGVHLDVDPQEIQAGLRTLSDPNNQPAGEAFLCDQLDNGAGYCRFLGQPAEFEKLLAQANPDDKGSIARKWLERPHGTECDTSCPQCMRDYGNMSYHSLLDWRLALDMARLATGILTIDLTSNWGTFNNPWQHTLSTAIPMTLRKIGYTKIVAFGSLRGYVHNSRPRIWLEVHPLWQENHPHYQQACMAAYAQYPNYEISMLNPFRALRRPSDYV